IITPHNAFNSIESVQRIRDTTLSNIDASFREHHKIQSTSKRRSRPPAYSTTELLNKRISYAPLRA
ncbi:MAG: hypothetical protein QME41_03420, partial [Actinomycetota bacterium]|nr:hypothetical protein [Actinomycetota bacterium]